MQKNPLELLRNNMSQLTKMQKKVGDYILSNVSEVSFLTIEELSKKINTSTTTIMRLTSNLGYSGYSDFQKSLKKLMLDERSPNNRLEINLKNIDKNDLWTQSINKHLGHIQLLTKLIDSELLKRVVKRIEESERIFCVGVRSGLPIIHHLAYGLNRQQGNCRIITVDDLIDITCDLTKKDTIIAVSFPRYANKILDITSVINQKTSAQIISFTDNYYAPIVDYSNIVIPCDSPSMAFHNSPISGMIVADYIISAVAIRNKENVKVRLNRTSAILDDIHYHYKN